MKKIAILCILLCTLRAMAVSPIVASGWTTTTNPVQAVAALGISTNGQPSAVTTNNATAAGQVPIYNPTGIVWQAQSTTTLYPGTNIGITQLNGSNEVSVIPGSFDANGAANSVGLNTTNYVNQLQGRAVTNTQSSVSFGLVSANLNASQLTSGTEPLAVVNQNVVTNAGGFSAGIWPSYWEQGGTLIIGTGNAQVGQNLDATYDTVIGFQSGGNLGMSSYDDTIIGANAYKNGVGGNGLSTLGMYALQTEPYGAQDTCVGEYTLQQASYTSNEVAIGFMALQNLGENTTYAGTNDIAIGAFAGHNYQGSESSDILIGNTGVPGENQTIRIGSSLQTNTVIAGVLTANGNGLTALNASQLTSGTVPASALNGVTITNAFITNSIFSGNGSGLTNLSGAAIPPLGISYLVTNNFVIPPLTVSNVTYVCSNNSGPILITFPPPQKGYSLTVEQGWTNYIFQSNSAALFTIGAPFVQFGAMTNINTNVVAMAGYPMHSRIWHSLDGANWETANEFFPNSELSAKGTNSTWTAPLNASNLAGTAPLMTLSNGVYSTGPNSLLVISNDVILHTNFTSHNWETLSNGVVTASSGINGNGAGITNIQTPLVCGSVSTIAMTPSTFWVASLDSVATPTSASTVSDNTGATSTTCQQTRILISGNFPLVDTAHVSINAGTNIYDAIWSNTVPGGTTFVPAWSTSFVSTGNYNHTNALIGIQETAGYNYILVSSNNATGSFNSSTRAVILTTTP